MGFAANTGRWTVPGLVVRGSVSTGAANRVISFSRIHVSDLGEGGGGLGGLSGDPYLAEWWYIILADFFLSRLVYFGFELVWIGLNIFWCLAAIFPYFFHIDILCGSINWIPRSKTDWFPTLIHEEMSCEVHFTQSRSSLSYLSLASPSAVYHGRHKKCRFRVSIHRIFHLEVHIKIAQT